MLSAVEVFRLSARLLPSDCPLRIWALSQSFPVRWGDLTIVAGMSAPTLAD